jgi:hypothetical protein
MGRRETDCAVPPTVADAQRRQQSHLRLHSTLMQLSRAARWAGKAHAACVHTAAPQPASLVLVTPALQSILLCSRAAPERKQASKQESKKARNRESKKARKQERKMYLLLQSILLCSRAAPALPCARPPFSPPPTQVPSLTVGGTAWFTDLTQYDPYYGLPLMCTAVTLAMVQYGINLAGDAGPMPAEREAMTRCDS